MIKTPKELASQFSMSYKHVTIVLSMKGSPGFKMGPGKKSSWLCDDEEFKEFLKKISEKYKG